MNYKLCLKNTSEQIITYYSIIGDQWIWPAKYGAISNGKNVIIQPLSMPGNMLLEHFVGQKNFNSGGYVLCMLLGPMHATFQKPRQPWLSQG